MGFKFQKSVFNGCHDLLMMSPDITNVAVTNIKSVDFHCIIYGVSNSVALHLLENSVLMVVDLHKMHFKEVNVK